MRVARGPARPRPAQDSLGEEDHDADDDDAERHTLPAEQVGPEQLLGDVEDGGAEHRAPSVPLPPRIAISTIQTPKVAPAKAVSRGSTKPSILPMAPPTRPSTKAAMVQAVIL